jgi:hypothetical protein
VGDEVASENFLEGVAIVDIESFLSYEEIEIERNRLFELAPAMKVAEVRLAGARIADRLTKGEMNPRGRALLQLRGQVAIEIYEAMRDNKIRHSRVKRMAKISLGAMAKISMAADMSEEAIFTFTGLRRRR